MVRRHGLIIDEEIQKAGDGIVGELEADLLAEVPRVEHGRNPIARVISHQFLQSVDILAHHPEVGVIIPGNEAAVANRSEKRSEGDSIGDVMLMA